MNIGFIDVLIFLGGFLLALLYSHRKKRRNHFDGTGVKYVIPDIPFVGNIFKVLLRREHFIDYLTKHYNQYPGEKYIGLCDGPKPAIFLKDINLIKQMGVKDFDHFPNRKNIIDEEVDSLFGKSLFSLQGEKWKDMRSTLSPAFTSSKMKNMFVFIEECSKNVAKHYLNLCKEMNKNVIEVEAKDTFTRYTNDVIANSAFGLEVNSLEHRDNTFYAVAKEILKIEFISSRAKDFFRALVNNTMKAREQNYIIRNDMIHLLMEAKKGMLKHEVNVLETADAGVATVLESSYGKGKVTRKWSDDDLVGQALIFLIAGFETTSVLITFFFYEMLCNPEIQQILQHEIDDFILNNHDNFKYGDLNKLKYLDACISETLRMWPPIVANDRICQKSYTLSPPNNSSHQTYTMKPGETLWVPIYAFHRDPKYFPNPNKFDPERFFEENRTNLEMGAYLPFGFGPRNCIGSRFALMVAKLIAFHVLAKFDIVATSKTIIPVELDKRTFNLLAKGGMHIGLRKRNN